MMTTIKNNFPMIFFKIRKASEITNIPNTMEKAGDAMSILIELNILSDKTCSKKHHLRIKNAVLKTAV